jgi:hypothetical protein
MVSVDEAVKLIRSFSGVTEGVRYRNRTWFVGKKGFAWERPLSKADIKRYGDEKPPAGPLLAVLAADLLEKEAALSANPRAFFTIQHFDGHPAFLIQLDKVTKTALKAALSDAYEAAANKKPRR